jgi:hypothetical protein
MNKKVTFRLKDKKKKEGTFVINGGQAIKDGYLQNIGYWQGSKSIFDADNKDTAYKKLSVTFVPNNHANDPGIEVTTNDKLLIDYLRIHPFFNKKYFEYDPDAVANEKAQKYDLVEKALGYVSDADDDIKALAVAVFGFEYFSKSESICRAALKQKAYENPQDIISVREDKKFESRYIISGMYCTNVIKNNNTNTAVVWAETGNMILPVAKGENGMDKLVEFIYSGTEEATTLLQEFAKHEKLKAKEDPKDRKIRELEEKLKAIQAGGNTEVITEEKKTSGSV